MNGGGRLVDRHPKEATTVAAAPIDGILELGEMIQALHVDAEQVTRAAPVQKVSYLITDLGSFCVRPAKSGPFRPGGANTQPRVTPRIRSMRRAPLPPSQGRPRTGR